MGAPMRRVVVAHDAAGKAVVVSDGVAPEAAMPGVGMLSTLWAADGPASYPDNGRDPQAPGLYPPVGGVRLIVSRFQPGQHIGASGVDVGVDWEEAGMHRTDTTDFDIVLDGEIVLVLDDQKEVVLSQGDVVVLAGARHAWRNDSEREAVVAFFMTGAERRAD